MSWKSWSLNILEPSGAQRACYGIPAKLHDVTFQTQILLIIDPVITEMPGVKLINH
jgi:hypothetical protein